MKILGDFFKPVLLVMLDRSDFRVPYCKRLQKSFLSVDIKRIIKRVVRYSFRPVSLNACMLRNYLALQWGAVKYHPARLILTFTSKSLALQYFLQVKFRHFLILRFEDKTRLHKILFRDISEFENLVPGLERRFELCKA